MTTNVNTESLIRFPDNCVTGAMIAANANIPSTKLAQRALLPFTVPFTRFRQWDSMAVNLPATAASDDLGLSTSSNVLEITTGDVKNATTSRKAGLDLVVPANYDNGESIRIDMWCGMETTVASGSATIDLNVYRSDGQGAVGSDLCTTAAQSINSLTKGLQSFDIDAATVVAGDILICILTIAVTDVATATAVTGVVNSFVPRFDTRG